MASQRRRVLIPGPKDGAGQQPAGGSGPASPGAPETCDCPELDPADWDGVESDWGDITFVATTVNAVAGVPVGFETARRALFDRAAALGATIPEGAMLLIGEGRFRRPLLLEVENVPDGERDVVRPGGVAYTRLVQAPWGELARAAKQLRAEAVERYGRQPSNIYAWYLTCRACSRERNFATLLVAHYPA